MQTAIINDFNAGWIASDHHVNGRKNGLLRMESLELDNQGALQMTRGTKNWNATNYGADAHSLYNAFLSGNRTHYLALTDNKVYRDTTNIFSSGSTVRAAFCKAFDYVWIWSGAARKRDDGTTSTDIGLTTPAAPTSSLNGAGILTGDYQYAVVEVYNSGSAYYAKSKMSTLSSSLSPAGNKISVDPATPTSPANEAWVYRRGGTMDNWYRISVRTSGTGFGAFDDNMSDQDAIELNEVANIYYSPTNSTGITDDILEALALINGRVIIFTKRGIHFTLINSPDSYDTRTSLGSASSAYNTGSELFLWAKKVAENIILVGTTADIYLLTGSYIQLPNGTLDIYFRSLSVHNPPISIDADVYNNQVVYMSKAGWVLCNISGVTTPLIYPNIDTLYRGNTIYGNLGVPIYIYPSLRYSCCVAKEKLWCRVPQIVGNDPSGGTGTFTYRMDIYDFVRKYWRSMQIKPLVIAKEDDDAVTGFFNDSARNIRLIDNPVFASDDRTLKGPGGTKQTVQLLTPFYNFNTPRQRKDCFNLKFKIDTNSENLTYNIYTNDSYTNIIATGTINTNSLSETIIDIHTSIGKIKSIAIGLTGTIGNFVLTDISLDYELLPMPVTYIKLLEFNYGANKKRARTWPIILDTKGFNVTFTPIIDGSNGATSILNAGYKKSNLHFFKSDIFGIDYGFSLVSAESPAQEFEFYEALQPEFVQILPVAKQFDQIGPAELFRYGKIRKIEFRLITFGGTTIPYNIYEEDISIATGNLTFTDSAESVQELSLPKGIYGSVLRIELGATSFNFHRIYTRIAVALSGKDTELTWKTLEAEPNG